MKMPKRRLVLPLVFGVLFVILFDSPFVYPFRLFVVFLHEISHGIAAVATGGAIVSIAISPDEGGVCLTRGGWPFVVLNAGYLGSLLWGALFLLLGARRRIAASVVATIGAFTLLATLLYVRSPFAFVYCLLMGLAFLVVATRLPGEVSAVVLAAIGAMSALYAVADMASDAIFRHVAASDASQLAHATGLPAVLWGVLWIAASFVTLVAVARRLACGLPAAKPAPNAYNRRSGRTPKRGTRPTE
jgi:hypothetical protein